MLLYNIIFEQIYYTLQQNLCNFTAFSAIFLSKYHKICLFSKKYLVISDILNTFAIENKERIMIYKNNISAVGLICLSSVVIICKANEER
ncbi:MAG: hypothetical protein EGP67_13330 [Bacteroidales bacterium]|nr:hypothetical protein [Bacteroidales bacterium]